MITPENVFPPEFERRLDVWRFRYWDHIDEYNDIFDPDEAKTPEWYREYYASFSDDPLSQFPADTGATATPATTGKAA